MRTYVDVYFTAGGAAPMKVAEAIRSVAGLSFVFGEHDLVITWDKVEELHEAIERLNKAADHMGVFFRFESHEDGAQEPEIHEISWPPMLPPESEADRRRN